MSDLETMKARIADELMRDDLTSNIASAITTAIEAYQKQRFAFNESRDVTFSTVASQEFYTSADDEDIPNFYAIDIATILIGNNTTPLKRETHDRLEWLSNNATVNGQPFDYAYFNRSIRLYPIPTSVWTIRLIGHLKVAAPAADDETGNVWMVDAERLIRSRAKQEIFAHVLFDFDKARVMNEAVSEALDELKAEQADQAGAGEIEGDGW